jgi:tripartite-type tricarboxylate transporter receptor subunit TctC
MPIAQAQPYPSRPIKLIVPYAPGGNTDIVARIFGQKLSERVGQPVVFDNRGGATGTLGVGVAAKSPNDGYTIVIGDLGSMVIANHAIPNRPYDPIKDFAPIALVTSVSIVVTVNPKSASSNFEDILKRARPTRQADLRHFRHRLAQPHGNGTGAINCPSSNGLRQMG